MIHPFPQISFQPESARMTEEVDFLSVGQCADLLEQYQAGKVTGQLPSDSVWAIHAAESQHGLLQLLEEGNPQKLCEFFNNIHYSTALVGYDQHSRMTNVYDEREEDRLFLARLIYSLLIRLATASGAARFFNPEQPGNFPYFDTDCTGQLTTETMKAIGVGTEFPVTAKGAIGLQTPFGLLTHRHVIGLGYLREIQNVLRTSGRKYSQIVEIGGGLGRTAYHAAKDIGLPYTVIDLPAVSVTQHALLTANGVNSRLWPGQPSGQPGSVSLLNAFAKHKPAHFENALFVNFDSFVEMGRETQNSYFSLIRKAGGDLLSVNHEANKKMTREGDHQNWDISRISKQGYQASARNVFWEREGYITQLFRNSAYTPADLSQSRRPRWLSFLAR